MIAKELEAERNYNLIRNLNHEVDKWRNIAVGLVENCVLKKNGVDADDKSYAEYWAALGEGDEQ